MHECMNLIKRSSFFLLRKTSSSEKKKHLKAFDWKIITHIGMSIYQINAEYLLNEKPPHRVLSALLQGFICVMIYFLHCLVQREAELALFFVQPVCSASLGARGLCACCNEYFTYGRQVAWLHWRQILQIERQKKYFHKIRSKISIRSFFSIFLKKDGWLDTCRSKSKTKSKYT